MAPAQPLCLLTDGQTLVLGCSINPSWNPWKAQGLMRFNSLSHYTYWKERGENPTVPLCSTASLSCTNFRHMAAFKTSWEGVRLNKARRGTAWQVAVLTLSTYTILTLYIYIYIYYIYYTHAPVAEQGSNRPGSVGWGKQPVKTCRWAALQPSPKLPEIQMKDSIHATNKCYTCSTPWLHAADHTSPAFRKTSDTGGNAWVGFAFVRNHTQSAAMGPKIEKALSFSQHQIKIPPRSASAFCLRVVKKPL